MTERPEYVLALDVGSRRIGVAIAHTIARLPSPLKTLERNEHSVQDIVQLVSYEHAGAVVVGLPRGLDGQDTDQTRDTQAFTDELTKLLSVPVYQTDEALTSVKAEAELGAKGGNYQKADVDALAAVYILEDFLHEHSEVANI